MGIVHATPYDSINVAPLGPALSQARTSVLVKTESLEVLQLVIPVGEDIVNHRTRGKVTIQCIGGEVGVIVNAVTDVPLRSKLLYLNKNQLNALGGVRRMLTRYDLTGLVVSPRASSSQGSAMKRLSR